MVHEKDIITIKISDEMRRKAVKLGLGRNKKSKIFGERIYSETDKIKSGNDTHTIALLGEIAVADFFNVPINEEIYHNHGDEGHDFILPGLGKVEIKTTTYFPESWLRVETFKFNESVENYILTAVTDEYVHIIGYISREDLLKCPKKKCFKNGPLNWIAKKENLHPIKDLL